LHSRAITEGGPNLSGLLGAFILSITVLMVVAIGILAAYATVIGILHVLAPQTRKPEAAPALVAAQTRAAHAGGD